MSSKKIVAVGAVVVAVLALLTLARIRSAGTGAGNDPMDSVTPQPVLQAYEMGWQFPGPGQLWEGPGYVRGPLDAAVTVVEFSDFGCPFCAKFALTTYPSLHKEFVETGKVRWIYIPFVMGMFPNGDQAALAAECAAEAGDAAFWKMHDELYETQTTWKSTRDPGAHFRAVAAKSGVPRKAFDACYGANQPAARIAASNDLSRRARVRATPTFFVQGQIVEGALPLPTFRALLHQAVLSAASAR